MRKVWKIARPNYVATPDGVTLKVQRAYIGNQQRCHMECVIMVIDSKGKAQIVQALLNTGCTRSIILKKFTKSKRRTKLNSEDQGKYTTWVGTFETHCKASVGFRLIEFKEKRKTNG